jgi:hypothetical protein
VVGREDSVVCRVLCRLARLIVDLLAATRLTRSFEGRRDPRVARSTRGLTPKSSRPAFRRRRPRAHQRVGTRAGPFTLVGVHREARHALGLASPSCRQAVDVPAPVGCQNPGRPIGWRFARGRPAGASDPALAKMPSPATAGDVVATASGPAQRRFVNVVIPEGSVTLGSGRDEHAGHGPDRVCAPHRLPVPAPHGYDRAWRRRQAV